MRSILGVGASMQNNDEQHEQDVSTPPNVIQNPNRSKKNLSGNTRGGTSSPEYILHSKFKEGIVTLYNELVEFSAKLRSLKDHTNLDQNEFEQIEFEVSKLRDMFYELSTMSRRPVPVLELLLDDFQMMITTVVTDCSNTKDRNNFKYFSESEFNPDDRITTPKIYHDFPAGEEGFTSFLAFIGDRLEKDLDSFNEKLEVFGIGCVQGLIENDFNQSKKQKAKYNEEYYINQILEVLKEVGRPLKLGDIYKKIKVDPDDPSSEKPADRVVSAYLSKLISCNILETVSPNGRKGFEQKMDGKFYILKSKNSKKSNQS